MLPTCPCSSIPILIYLPCFSDFCLWRRQQPQPASQFGAKSHGTEFLSKSRLFFHMIETLDCIVIVTSSNDPSLTRNSDCKHVIWLFPTEQINLFSTTSHHPSKLNEESKYKELTFCEILSRMPSWFPLQLAQIWLIVVSIVLPCSWSPDKWQLLGKKKKRHFWQVSFVK